MPIDDALPALGGALAARNAAVLIAPPGAGKTTRVPLALLDEPWAKGGRILVLEPRRIAARGAAERMAGTLGERVGETVGLRVRFGSKVSARTRVEIVTEGIFTRMIIADPALDGVAAVLFDEFHERSLDADLGLALALDAQQGLREDLRILVMSATLDGARVSRLLGNAEVIESAGRAFPVETRWIGRDPREPIEAAMAGAILRALREADGSILAFLPGAAEIRRTERRLVEAIADPTVDIAPLHGTLDPASQDRAIAPAAPGRRKVVLATAIAETSLTIEGVRVVIDSGLARVPRFEPDLGLTRLETVRVSRASADQRRGRAGRTAPGVCYRLWDEPQDRSLDPFARPEILNADLSGLVLDLAEWGVTDPATLAWLDPPPAAAVAEAKALLARLGAIDADGRITAEGVSLRAVPLEPRLARMLVDAERAGQGRLAGEIAALLTERGLGEGRGPSPTVDVAERLMRFRADDGGRARDVKAAMRRWREAAGARPGPDDRAANDPAETGAVLALAYPDRVARARGGGSGAFLLANGRAAALDPASPLARETWLAVAEIGGTAGAARILSAAALSAEAVMRDFADQITTQETVTFDVTSGSVRARAARRLGAIAFDERAMPVPATPEAAAILARGVAALGIGRLAWSKAQRQLRDRVGFLRRAEPETWPDLSDEGLAAAIRDGEDWLGPFILGLTAASAIDADRLGQALAARLPYPLPARLDREAPTHFDAPSGSRVPIDYAGEEPLVSIRVQELFGLTEHPRAAGRPLVIELLSPAHRPVQMTRDLPGFWRGSYAAVRAEMRGRYPKHPWPEDPAAAQATTRAKPRGT